MYLFKGILSSPHDAYRMKVGSARCGKKDPVLYLIVWSDEVKPILLNSGGIRELASLFLSTHGSTTRSEK